eukprot:GSA120T00024229001.1
MTLLQARPGKLDDTTSGAQFPRPRLFDDSDDGGADSENGCADSITSARGRSIDAEDEHADARNKCFVPRKRDHHHQKRISMTQDHYLQILQHLLVARKEDSGIPTGFVSRSGSKLRVKRDRNVDSSSASMKSLDVEVDRNKHNLLRTFLASHEKALQQGSVSPAAALLENRIEAAWKLIANFWMPIAGQDALSELDAVKYTVLKKWFCRYGVNLVEYNNPLLHQTFDNFRKDVLYRCFQAGKGEKLFGVLFSDSTPTVDDRPNVDKKAGEFSSVVRDCEHHRLQHCSTSLALEQKKKLKRLEDLARRKIQAVSADLESRRQRSWSGRRREGSSKMRTSKTCGKKSTSGPGKKRTTLKRRKGNLVVFRCETENELLSSDVAGSEDDAEATSIGPLVSFAATWSEIDEAETSDADAAEMLSFCQYRTDPFGATSTTRRGLHDGKASCSTGRLEERKSPRGMKNAATAREKNRDEEYFPHDPGKSPSKAKEFSSPRGGKEMKQEDDDRTRNDFLPRKELLQKSSKNKLVVPGTGYWARQAENDDFEHHDATLEDPWLAALYRKKAGQLGINIERGRNDNNRNAVPSTRGAAAVVEVAEEGSRGEMTAGGTKGCAAKDNRGSSTSSLYVSSSAALQGHSPATRNCGMQIPADTTAPDGTGSEHLLVS